MNILEGQQQVSLQFPMPVDVMDAASSANVVTGETISFIVAATNVADAGSAAGTLVYARTAFSNIMDSARVRIGDYADTSFSFVTGTILTSMQPFPLGSNYERLTNGNTIRLTKMQELTKNFTNGQFVFDHRSGLIVGLKATTGTSDTANYVYRGSVSAGTTITQTSTNVNGVTVANNLQTLTPSVAIPSINITTTAGNLFSFCFVNGTGVSTYLALYNKASAPSIGTDTPVQFFGLIGNTASLILGEDWWSQNGSYFSQGVGVALVSGLGANSATVAGATSPSYRISYRAK